MNQKTLVIGIGELLWDVFPTHKQMGGAPANFAYHVSQMGIDSLVISAVGRDELGEELVGVLDKSGLNYDIQKTEYPTGTVKVALSGDGIPDYEICKPVAWDFIDMKPEYEAIAKQTQAVCFGSLAQRSKMSNNTISHFVSSVSESALKIFDINLRQQFYSKELIEKSLGLCNILKINDDEIGIVAELFGLTGTMVENCKELIRRFNLKLVSLTCGTEGSYLVTLKESSFLSTPKVTVADTVGAGDSFTAAVVAGLLKKKSLKETHEMAVKLSAFVCTQKGAMPVYQKGLV